MRILAIDQGTTSTRALLREPDGRLIPLLALPHRQIYPHSGWVEHDPQELLTSIDRCLDAAMAAGGVAAFGLDNQGESCLAWDAADGRPIAPVIVWQDDRTQAVTDQLRTEGLEPLVLERAGLPLDPYFSASKLGWIMRNIPEAARLASIGRLRLGTTDAYFRDRLTGRFETDVTTASRTSLMNLDRCTWDADLCEIFGVPVDALPTIGDSAGALGHLSARHGGLPLTASIVDQQAALYGHGCRAPGDGKITFGTGAFALALTGALHRGGSGGPLPTVAWRKAGEPAVYALDGGVYCAGSAVNWARGLGLFSSYGEIDGYSGPTAAERGLVFIPALAGLACPHWDRTARGSWMGLALDHTGTDLMRALLEGIALRTAEVLDSMRSAVALNGPISIDGGLSANSSFCSFLADAIGADISVSDDPELTARGVAELAAEAAGLQAAAAPHGRLVRPARPADSMAVARRRFTAGRLAVEGFGRGE